VSSAKRHWGKFPPELRTPRGVRFGPNHQLGFLLSAGLPSRKKLLPAEAPQPGDLEYVGTARARAWETGSTVVSDYNPRYRQIPRDHNPQNVIRFPGIWIQRRAGCCAQEIRQHVRSQLKNKLMLWLCSDALVRREKIEVPSYTGDEASS